MERRNDLQRRFPREIPVALLIVVGAGMGISALGDSNSSAETRDPLEATRLAYRQSVDEAAPSESELAKVRLELAEAYKKLAAENKVFQRRQREFERSDPIANGLRKKLLYAERQVRELRASLNSRIEAIEEIQALDDQRRDLMAELNALRDRQRELQTGMAAAKGSAP
jgi:predicted  nucleic acid-binding Zn-ribbon protein